MATVITCCFRVPQRRIENWPNIKRTTATRFFVLFLFKICPGAEELRKIRKCSFILAMVLARPCFIILLLKWARKHSPRASTKWIPRKCHGHVLRDREKLLKTSSIKEVGPHWKTQQKRKQKIFRALTVKERLKFLIDGMGAFFNQSPTAVLLLYFSQKKTRSSSCLLCLLVEILHVGDMLMVFSRKQKGKELVAR